MTIGVFVGVGVDVPETDPVGVFVGVGAIVPVVAPLLITTVSWVPNG
jgi:hypothetical protein